MTIYLVINPDHLRAFDLLSNAEEKVEEIIEKEYPDFIFEKEIMHKRIDWVEHQNNNVISIHFLELNKKVKK